MTIIVIAFVLFVAAPAFAWIERRYPEVGEWLDE